MFVRISVYAWIYCPPTSSASSETITVGLDIHRVDTKAVPFRVSMGYYFRFNKSHDLVCKETKVCTSNFYHQFGLNSSFVLIAELF